MDLKFISKEMFSVHAIKTSGMENSNTFRIARTSEMDENLVTIQKAKAFTYNNMTREIYNLEIIADKEFYTIIIFFE